MFHQQTRSIIYCVNLDGWTVDFLAARRKGFEGRFNSRMSVGPIETLGHYGSDIGLKEMMLDKQISWFINKDFRLAILKTSMAIRLEKVIDFTNYQLQVVEPAEMTRR